MAKITNHLTGKIIAEDETKTVSTLAEENKAKLSGADLSEADFSGAKLSGANLYRADFSGAKLSGANLCGANLSLANLSGANLYVANLSLANLYRANLTRADLSGAGLTGAVGCIPLPIGDPRQYRPVAVWVCGAWRIYSGCQACTIAEAREHWGADNYHTPSLGAQYVAAMDWLEQQPTPVTAREDEVSVKENRNERRR